MPEPVRPVPYQPSGLVAEGRTWYLSALGGNCRDTCATNGLVYSWASPSEASPIIPRLLARQPKERSYPWAHVECYMPSEDAYHTINRNAWGVPDQTIGSDFYKAANWSDSTCQLACPCTPKAQIQCRYVQPAACTPSFVWKGVQYTGCPTVDSDKPWCQHHHHLDHDEHTIGSDWSPCLEVCDDDYTPVSNCGWTPSAGCAAEFVYDGAHYVGCTTADNHSPWCSKKPVYDGSWSHCHYDCTNPTAIDTRLIVDLNKYAENENEICSWHLAAECVPQFRYQGVLYNGCTMIDHTTPWCSHDATHVTAWSSCKRVCSSGAKWVS